MKRWLRSPYLLVLWTFGMATGYTIFVVVRNEYIEFWFGYGYFAVLIWAIGTGAYLLLVAFQLFSDWRRRPR